MSETTDNLTRVCIVNTFRCHLWLKRSQTVSTITNAAVEGITPIGLFGDVQGRTADSGDESDLEDRMNALPKTYKLGISRIKGLLEEEIPEGVKIYQSNPTAVSQFKALVR